MTLPCNWPDPTGLCCPEWAAFPAEVQQRAADIASQVLFSATGHRFGTCEVTVRPCGEQCPDYSTYSGPVTSLLPVIRSGQWFNCPDCGCPARDCCCPVCDVTLPGPVDEIVEVLLDGAVVDDSTYRVDDRRKLVRIPPASCWPRCQELGREPTEPGTFQITYMRGIPVPPALLAVYGTYACELGNACVGKPCRLPKRVTTLAREGVTMQLLDPLEFIAEGRTGLPEVDVVIKALNPQGLTSPSGVFSPDIRTVRQPTWP